MEASTSRGWLLGAVALVLIACGGSPQGGQGADAGLAAVDANTIDAGPRVRPADLYGFYGGGVTTSNEAFEGRVETAITIGQAATGSQGGASGASVQLGLLPAATIP